MIRTSPETVKFDVAFAKMESEKEMFQNPLRDMHGRSPTSWGLDHDCTDFATCSTAAVTGFVCRAGPATTLLR